MPSQWDCLLQNLGVWEGSFTRLSPEGTVMQDTPTVVSFEGLNQNQTMRQVVRRFVPGTEGELQPDDKVLEYSSLGRGILFFDSGAFSQGSIQYGPFSEFGAELGLMAGDRRLRLVQLFDRDSRISQLTLIRERRAETSAPDRPQLSLDALLGEWQGEAETLYPDLRSPDTLPTHLSLKREGDQLQQRLTFGQGSNSSTIASTAQIEGSWLSFNQGHVPVRVLLLPDGASATFPLQIQPRQFFFLEVGWLLQPDLRQRMIRSYSPKGEWVSLTLVTERKVS